MYLVSTVFDRLPLDILFNLFTYLSYRDLARLRACSLHFTVIIAQLFFDRCFGLFRAFDFNDEEIPAVFKLLEYHNCAVVGVSALRIMHPHIAPASQLEFLCQGSPHSFALDLEENFGRSVVKEGVGAADVCTQLGLRFFGQDCSGFVVLGKAGSTKKILVVGTSDRTSVVGKITEFPSTLLMNFVAGDGFYCLYPGLTSEGKGYDNLPVDASKVDVSVPVLERLNAEGFVLDADPVTAIGEHRCGVHPYCPSSPRVFPGPPQLLVDFHAVRNCTSSGSNLTSPVTYILRSASACGRPPGPDRDVSWDQNGFHMAEGQHTGESSRPLTLPNLN